MSSPWIATADVPAPLRTPSFWLEPLGPEHNERDHRAWTASIDHIHATPGFAPGEWGDDDWPFAMPLEQNLADLVMHRGEFDRGEAFAYSVLADDADIEPAVIGCVYIDPDPTGACEAAVRCWVSADHRDLDRALFDSVQAWIADAWPIERARFPGR